MPSDTALHEIKKYHDFSRSWEKTANRFNRAHGVRLSKTSYRDWVVEGKEPASAEVRQAFGLGDRPCPHCHRRIAHRTRNPRPPEPLPAFLRWWRGLGKDARERMIRRLWRLER